MTDLIANLFVDVHPSKTKLSLFLDCNCFIIASTVTDHSLQQILLRAGVDSSASSLCNAAYVPFALGLRLYCMEHELKLILTLCTDSRYFSKFQKIQSP